MTEVEGQVPRLSWWMADRGQGSALNVSECAIGQGNAGMRIEAGLATHDTRQFCRVAPSGGCVLQPVVPEGAVPPDVFFLG